VQSLRTLVVKTSLSLTSGTCNASTYNSSGCRASWRPTHPALDGQLQLQLGVRECPAAGTLPYVSLSCAGPLCDQLFKPCHADADWCVLLAMACP